MMQELIKNLPLQIKESIQIFEVTGIPPLTNEIHQVVIAGLGGSGIGGSIIADLAKPYAHIPVVVTKDYSIPAFVNQYTLFIASSYSGNTEETLMALEHALERKAQIICITSGGKLAEIAKKHQLGLLLIPGGYPPRACLGYSLTQLICIFHKFRLLPDSTMNELQATVNLLNHNAGNIQNEARQLSQSLHQKIPVIYADASMEGVAIRFRQQLNENSKMLAWHHVVPEMNHNELVGWAAKNENLAVVYLRNKDDYARNQARISINREVISKYAASVHDVWSQGNSRIEQTFYHIHCCDWVSYYLSELRGVDIMDIQVIDQLKNELAKL
ncbi:MAG: bifunctional phosphoglucose/phosphomannose isomerase [Flavobacteriales bacterium]|nr:bifunctional phosphoglucose/phosphomannose isomerase [Flavobacteriales bacterium]